VLGDAVARIVSEGACIAVGVGDLGDVGVGVVFVCGDAVGPGEIVSERGYPSSLDENIQ